MVIVIYTIIDDDDGDDNWKGGYKDVVNLPTKNILFSTSNLHYSDRLHFHFLYHCIVHFQNKAVVQTVLSQGRL